MAEISVKKSIYGYVKGKTETLANGLPYSKAMLAKLRKGVGKRLESNPDAWDILLEGLDERLLSSDGTVSIAEEAIYAALTLYAVHQQGKSEQMSRGNDSFGAAIKKLKNPDGSNEESIRRRFNAIVTANDFAEITHYTRGMVQMLKSKDIPLDYGLFASDLYELHFPIMKNKVMLRWGEDYYRKGRNNKEEREEATNEE